MAAAEEEAKAAEIAVGVAESSAQDSARLINAAACRCLSPRAGAKGQLVQHRSPRSRQAGRKIYRQANPSL
jgi:hypothetical protein